MTSIRRSLLNSLVIGVVVSLVAASFPVWYFSMKAGQREQAAVYQGTVRTVSELAGPSLLISNYRDTQRLLGLISDQGHVSVAILTKDNDLLLSDYMRRDEFLPVTSDVQACIGGRVEGFYCHAVTAPASNVILGFALLKTKSSNLIYQPWYLLSGLALATLILIMATIALKTLIDKKIVSPLERLRTSIERSSSTLGENESAFELVELDRLQSAFQTLLKRVKNENEKRIRLERLTLQDEIERKRQRAVVELASQVAHDIRSPLSALKMAEPHLTSLPEDVRNLMRVAVSRINDIANHLLDRSKTEFSVGSSASLQPHLVSDAIESLISEKRMQFRDRLDVEIAAEIDSSARMGFALIQTSEFHRLLSNLINNGVEALTHKGSVKVGLRVIGEHLEITVTDTGKGIPQERLPLLGVRGATFDKPGGTGLGLSHARETVLGWSGSFEIESAEGVSTTVRILLKSVPAPQWFADGIVLKSNSILVAVDDDHSVHALWEKKARSAEFSKHGIQLIHFTTPEHFKIWKSQNTYNADSVQYLIDQEFAQKSETGLELAEELQIERSSVLVTSRSDDKVVRERSRKLGVKIMPKSAAPYMDLQIN